MKWQDFYFQWLEYIGYFKWWNATLQGHKTPEPIGGSAGIGTVGFSKGDGLPDDPTVLHPAQTLIDDALEDTARLDPIQIRRMRSRQGGGLNNPLLTYLSEDRFGEAQKNTLRYWGVQPEGATFLPDSNFYRGYEYFINNMKQKYAIRGPRGSRLVRGKDFVSDKLNRTYPTTRRSTVGQMIAAKHPDYQDYADVGNIMQIEWGVFNGYSKIVYSPLWSQEDCQSTLAPSSADILTSDDPPEELASNEAWEWLNERTQVGQNVIMRNKLFNEVSYIDDKLKHELLENMTQILLSELPQISMLTAETILQYLSINLIGLGEDGHPTVPEGYTETLEAMPLSSDTILQLQRLISLWPLGVNIPEGSPHSFYLNFPMCSDLLIPKGGNQQQPDRKQMEVFGNAYNGPNSPSTPGDIAGGYKYFLNGQEGNIVFILALLDWWETYTIVDEELQPFIVEFRAMFGRMVDRNNEGRDSDNPIATLMRTPDAELCKRMTMWLFHLPSWVNIDYAIMLCNYGYAEQGTNVGNVASFDALPREITFDIEYGEPKYAYDILLMEWWPLYQSPAPSISDLRYWEIYTTFLHPSTKKTRGMETPELMEIHAINLSPDPHVRQHDEGIKFNHISISSIENATALMSGNITSPDEVPQITYKFWDTGVYWPQYTHEPPDNSPSIRSMGGQQHIGILRSFLTPMTTIHNQWWNEFLGENGILAMETEDADNQGYPIKLGDGWDIGWSWNYMENVIWTNRLNGIEWANDITLEDFAARVYPTALMKVNFRPKLDSNAANWLVSGASSRQVGLERATATKQQSELFRSQRKNMVGDETDLAQVMTFPQPFGRSPAPQQSEGGGISMGYTNPYDYVTTEGSVINYMENANQLRRGTWTWRPMKAPPQARPDKQIHHNRLFNNSITMEDDGGNIAIIANNTPYLRSFDGEKWDEVRGAQGYMSENLSWVGSHENMLNRAIGNGDSPNQYADVPKIIIEGVPDDIFEMEELTNLSNKTIDYTAPTSSPWRRGKIPLINWAAILSSRILSMIMPQEE